MTQFCQNNLKLFKDILNKIFRLNWTSPSVGRNLLYFLLLLIGFYQFHVFVHLVFS